MRFRELRLTAFGPFTDQTLGFGDDHDVDFHVVLGPNEAGKTSMLRAIDALLFGVPGQTKDAFLHPYSQIRVGAVLELPDGGQLDVTRVKANLRDLRGPDDEPISDEALRAALGGIDAALYRRLFLVSHEELREGGQGLAAGGGDYGISLFGAALGSGNLASVRFGLERRAGELFSPRAQARNPPVNAALGSYRSHLADVKALSVKPREYEDATRRVQDLEAERTAKRRELQALEHEAAGLRRLSSITSPLARLRVVTDELKGLVDVPSLSSNAKVDREHQTERRARAEAARDAALENLEELNKEIEATPVDEPLLAGGPRIRTLAEAIQRHESALKDRGRREDELAGADEKARGLRAEIGVALPETVTAITRAVSTQVGDLGEEDAALRQREQDAAAAVKRLKDQLENAQGEIDDAARPDELPAAILSVTADLESKVQSFVATRERSDETRLELDRVNREALALTPPVVLSDDSLSPPALGVIDEHALLVEEHRRSVERVTSDRDATVSRIATLREQLAATESGGIEQIGNKLTRARDARDATLVQLGSELDVGAIEAARISHGRLEPEIEEADSLSDAQLAQADALRLNSQIDELTRQLDSHEEQLKALGDAQSDWLGIWVHLWTESGLEPAGGPGAMQAWREHYDTLRGRYDGLRAQQSEQNLQLSEYREACGRLAAALAEAGHPVAEGISEEQVLADARAVIEQTAANIAAHDALIKALADTHQALEGAEQAVQQVENARADWTTRWEDALDPLPIANDTSVAWARQAVALINEIEIAEAAAANLKHRIDRITADFEAFADEARAVAADAAPDLDAEDPLVIARTLADQLSGAQEVRATRAGLDERRAGLEKTIEEHRHEMADADAAIGRLMSSAGCESVDDLPEIERRAERRAELERERSELEVRIVELGEHPIGDLEEELAGRTGDEIQAALVGVSDELDAAREEENGLIEAHTRAESEQQALDHGTQAAAAREAAEAAASDAALAIEQYLSERAASVLLVRAIEYHREHSATPVLDRAQQLLPQLTAGSLTRLFVDDTESGKPVLMARRADSAIDVGVEAMSDGTLDQLYLALRLAALEHHLGAVRPLPVLLDDVLVHYDEQRVAAALPALASVGERSQVIMLTHHEHVANIARDVLGESVRVHSL